MAVWLSGGGKAGGWGQKAENLGGGEYAHYPHGAVWHQPGWHHGDWECDPQCPFQGQQKAGGGSDALWDEEAAGLSDGLFVRLFGGEPGYGTGAVCHGSGEGDSGICGKFP